MLFKFNFRSFSHSPGKASIWLLIGKSPLLFPMTSGEKHPTITPKGKGPGSLLVGMKRPLKSPGLAV